jgi:hypothetical protein
MSSGIFQRGRWWWLATFNHRVIHVGGQPLGPGLAIDPYRLDEVVEAGEALAVKGHIESVLQPLSALPRLF